MKRLLVLGDSLVFGRPNSSEPVSVAESWPEIIKASREELDVHIRGRGSSSSRDVLRDLKTISPYYPNGYFSWTVIQVGIVDAAPRALPRVSDRCLASLPMREASRSYVRRNSVLLSLWGRPWVSPNKFRRSMEAIVVLALEISRQLLLVSVQPPDGFLRQNLGIFDVAAYNRQLREVEALSPQIKLLQSEYDLHIDGHHLSRIGHRGLAADLLAEIS